MGGGGGCFFFQAEDGIRDYKVTGVQTCALPICCVYCFFTVKVNKGVVETTKSYFQARGQNEPM